MANQADHDESKAKRGPDGRFLPGHKPPRSPGRPPGPNGVKARAARVASNRLEEMLGQAADVIEMALDEGDVRAATWLIDRIRPPKQSDFLKADIVTELKTPEEIVEAARETTVAAGRGEVALSEARAYIDLLTRYGAIQGYLEVERLKEMIEMLKAPRHGRARIMDQSRLAPEFRLKWGQGVAVNLEDAADRETN
ncbi:hypothetical protein R3X27_24965 [Tropicimonas sp. TH_r6]|uniref:hypothetical protein n=1 Tax=Tropicimonas sp. TH_r6 TaxID=3082085 RepID=UPI002955AA6A|nr:hypothetical protein [Tropicimonas sp. TH_r6]MDV7145941.1 hypothetical protein [Tropicimonas sp. TH_r6]